MMERTEMEMVKQAMRTSKDVSVLKMETAVAWWMQCRS